RREKERRLPDEPERRSHSVAGRLDASCQVAQQERTEPRDEYRDDCGGDPRRTSAPPQDREQSEQRDRARNRQRASIRRQRAAERREIDGWIEESGEVRELIEWHECAAGQSHA